VTGGTPLVLSGSKGRAVCLIDAFCPVVLGTDNSIIRAIKGTARAVAGVADIRFLPSVELINDY